MSRNATLGQIREDVRYYADIQSSEVRHADTSLNRLINQAIQRFREKLSIEGAQHYLTSTTGTLTAGAASPYAFTSLDLSGVSPSVVRTIGVDLTLNNAVRSLLHVPFDARNDYGGPQRSGIPQAWAHYGTRKIAILPPSDSTYTYTVWYLPVLADLEDDADTFDGVVGWEEFLVWDVVRRIIVRDKDQGAYVIANDYANNLLTDILRTATKVTNAGGAVIGRDTFGERYRSFSRSQSLPDP